MTDVVIVEKRLLKVEIIDFEMGQLDYEGKAILEIFTYHTGSFEV